ncbi:proteinase-activated receptor 1-like [Hyperolius riggenbachi]|uniref:proteinase-activated receptor 1-like n=1 Tax=Hyperolius riggenbachi TaxID=752182 RepID=UPI0035A38EFE
MLSVVVLVSLPLYVLNIRMFLRMKPEKGVVVYLLSLSIIDALYTAFLLLTITYRFSENNWIFGEVSCRVVTVIFYFRFGCSAIHLTCITWTCRGAALPPIAVYPPVNRMRKAFSTCYLIWFFSLLTTLPVVFSHQTQEILELGIMTCHDVQPSDESNLLFVYFYANVVSVWFIIPFGAICWSCIELVRHFTAARTKIVGRKRRTLVLAFIMLCVFALCYGPTNIIIIYHFVGHLMWRNPSLNFAYILCASTSSLTCCLSPLISYYASRQYRKCVRKLARRIIKRAQTLTSWTSRSTPEVEQGDQPEDVTAM